MIYLTLPLLHHMAEDLHEPGDKLIVHQESSAAKTIQAEIKILEKTVERSHQTPLLDEFLRYQIWNLSESLKLLPPTAPLYEEGMQTLDAALKRYTALKREITLSLRRVKDLSFDSDYQTLIELAEHPDRLESYAKSLEQQAKLGSWKKGKARCGPTARGILYHFLTRYGDAEAPTDCMQQQTLGAKALLAHLKQHQNDPTLWLYYIDSDRLDHVFVLQQTPRRDYCLYQSYVNQYSLEASLSTMTPLHFDQTIELAELLTYLDEEGPLTPHLEAVYEALFHTRMPKSVREQFAERKPDIRFVPFSYYRRP